MRLYLLRHGETEWNVQRRFQGIADIPLNAMGSKQAQWVAEYFTNIKTATVFTSPLIRAIVTAQAIALRNDFEIIMVESLKEIDVGNWQGLTWEEAQHRPNHDGETLQEFYQRCQAAIEEVIMKKCSHSIVVTHGGTLRMILVALLGLTIDDRDLFKPSNVGVYMLELVNGKWQLMTDNDTSHIPLNNNVLIGDDRNA